MAFNIIANRKNASAVLHFTSNTTITVAGNNSVSNIAKPGEIVNGASIVQATFGTASGDVAYWQVFRGDNLVAVFDSTAQLDFAGSGQSINLFPTENLRVELAGSTPGFLILEVQKLDSQYDYYLPGGN